LTVQKTRIEEVQGKGKLGEQIFQEEMAATLLTLLFHVLFFFLSLLPPPIRR